MVWIIVMFLSIVWTLILTAPIHCRASKRCNATFLQIRWRNKAHLTHTVAKSRGFVSPVCLNEHLVVKPPHKRVRVFVSLQEVLDNTSNCISQISQNGQSASPWQVAVLHSDWLSQADSSSLWLAESGWQFFTLIGWVELTVLYSDWLSSSLWLAESGWQFFTLIGWVELTVLHSDWLSSSLWLAELSWQFFTLIGWVRLTVLHSDWLSWADSSSLWLAEFFTLIGWVRLTVLHSDWLSWADSSSLWLAEFFTLIGWVRLTVLYSDWLSSSLWLAELSWQFFTLIGWVELTVLHSDWLSWADSRSTDGVHRTSFRQSVR